MFFIENSSDYLLESMISIPIQILYVHGHLRINYAIYGFLLSTSGCAKLLLANVLANVSECVTSSAP